MLTVKSLDPFMGIMGANLTMIIDSHLGCWADYDKTWHRGVAIWFSRDITLV